jgi:NitT/TauT family transport system substrate-binding protein
MRKIIIAIFLVIAICVVGFAGCNHGELTTVKVCEVTHSIFYAPQYVAIALGYFEDEGLEIELTNGGGANNVTAALLSGDSDIGLCGPEATIYVYNQGETDYIVNFAQLTQCDGSFLLAREPDPDFDIQDVVGSLIIGGRKGGMPEMTLEWVLKQNGIIPGVDVTIDTSIAFNAMSGGFVGGIGDYVALFEPNATALENEGIGYVVMSIGEMSGKVPYTVYNARKSYIEENPKIIKSFVKAIEKGQEYVSKHTAEEVAALLTEFFPDTSMDDLISVVQRYKDIEAYAENTQFTEESFNLMQEIVKEAGELTEYAPYDKLVTNEFSR